jgi:hypothetical protein
MRKIDTREHTEGINGKDPHYPGVDELEEMSRFYAHYMAFRNTMSINTASSDCIGLYAVYVSKMRD